MHELADLVGSGVASVVELEVVVQELRVLLEVVLLASEELVDLHEVRAVERVSFLDNETISLRSGYLRAGVRGGHGTRR